MGESTGAVPAVERRRWPRRSRHHEAHVHWKHIAVYVPVVLLVTLLGGLSIWSFIEKQSLVIVPEPPPRLTLVTADARSPLAAAWVRLLNAARIETTLVPVAQLGAAPQGVVALCDVDSVPASLRGHGLAILGTPPSKGPVRLVADHGKSDDVLALAATASPILARLHPGSEVPARPSPVALLEETPAMHVDARWRASARAAVMHMELPDGRVLWIGFDPDTVAPNPALLLMLRTAVRWLGGQPISDGPSDRFAFSVEPLGNRRSFAVRMINRGDQPVEKPSVQVWFPPGVSKVALGGDWIMRRGASLTRQEDTWVVSLQSLGRREERVLKLTAE